MKKIFSILIALFAVSILSAQVPQGFSYQAVVRDNSNAVLANTHVELTVSILQGQSPYNATTVYTEVDTAFTNANGLFSIVIGQGQTSQSFSVIDWTNGNYYIKTESAYGTSTTQLLSVPFAMYAAKSGDSNIDLSGYALKSDIPSDLGSFTNDANYLTATDVASMYLSKEAFEAYVLTAGNPDAVDLSLFAKTADLENYAKNSELAKYAKSTELENYAKTTDIPKKVSDLTNDIGYLTQHQSLSGYAKTSDLNNYAKKTDLNSYAKTTDVPTKLSQLTADKIGDMPMATVQVSITNYDNYVSVDFLGKTLTSGTSTYKIPAYCPVFITVNQKETYPDPKYVYAMSLTVNGVAYSHIAGYSWSPTTDYWGFYEDGALSQNFDLNDIELFGGFSVVQKFDKIPVYKNDGTDFTQQGVVRYNGINNQIIGPFSPTTTNTINITVTKKQKTN